MDRTELLKSLVARGVDAGALSISGVPDDDQLVLAQEGAMWVVYFHERGKRVEEQVFASESDACQAFFARASGWG